MKSIWQETPLPEFPQLEGDIKTDVLIIGGGISGLLTAYFLHKEGVKYVLVEKDRICGENTCNTTAKISSQHGLIYHKILSTTTIIIVTFFFFMPVSYVLLIQVVNRIIYG